MKSVIYIFFLLFLTLMGIGSRMSAQELNAKVSINRSQVSNTKSEVFESLEKKIADFLNTTKWTDLEFKESEKIQCNFNITVNTYSDTDNSFTCTLLMSSMRPVYNSNYNTVAYSTRDAQFSFRFTEFDQLEYNSTNIDNNLVALLAYYAYMIIGIDSDTMELKGGTPYFQQAEDIVSAGQNMDFPGWKSFDDNKNRFGLLNDYMDGSMEPMRTLLYEYHRKGLDQMSANADTARANIVKALDHLEAAHKAKLMSQVPQLFTEYKREEIVNIFSGKGTREEKDRAYEVLFAIDASQNETWQKIKK